MNTSLQGKRALVTAAARVHVCDIDEAAIRRLRADQPAIGAAVCDVADAAAVDRQKTEALSRVSLRTLVTNQDVANMALFLATPAGQHISGQALSVCGNVEVLG